MRGQTNIHDFCNILDQIVDEHFPRTEKYVIKSGDIAKDLVLELRESGKALRYSPYRLFKKSSDYEDTIDLFIKQWAAILQQ